MRIGILSDTHGHVDRSHAAAMRLCREEVEALLHCGDIGSPDVLECLVEVCGPNIPIYAVHGNVDLYMGDRFAVPGATVFGRFGELTLGDTRIAIIHGDDNVRLMETVASESFDLVLTGHTHLPDDHTFGPTRIINPGAVYRSKVPSVATLDLESGKLELIPFWQPEAATP